MPKGLVEGERDERLWKRAKALVRKQYPEVAEDSDRFWRLVNGIYGKMRKGEAEGGRGPGRGLGTGRGRGRKDGTGPRAGTPACPVEKAAEEPPVGSGERFRRLQGKLARRGDVRDPAAVAAAIGRKKYGKKRFQEMATAGRVKKSVRPLLVPAPLADQLRKAARQLGFNFDESKHPRVPKGSSKGGQFQAKGGGGGEAVSPPSGGRAGGGGPRSEPAKKLEYFDFRDPQDLERWRLRQRRLAGKSAPSPEEPSEGESGAKLTAAQNFAESLESKLADVTPRTCDHTHTRTLAAIREAGYSDDQAQTIIDELEEHGGYCDCEIAANVLGGDRDAVVEAALSAGGIPAGVKKSTRPLLGPPRGRRP